MDTVSSCRGTDRIDCGTCCFGNRSGNRIGLYHADGHGIDQAIIGITVFEINITGNSRNAKTITVIANAFDNAVEQITVFLKRQRPEAQRIKGGDRPGSHGKNITHNTTDTGGRPLIGFYSRGMIMTFYFESNRIPISDIHQPGVFFTGFYQQVLSFSGQCFQLKQRVFIAAVFTPHDRINSQFRIRRCSA